MHVGRLLTQGPIAQVRAVGEARARVVTDRPQEAARVLRGLGLTDVVAEPGVAEGTLGKVAAEKVVVALVRDEVPVTGFVVERPSLEDLFVSLTGEGFNVSG
jgi:ABC-2 type transport system ATP-binding protein